MDNSVDNILPKERTDLEKYELIDKIKPEYYNRINELLEKKEDNYGSKIEELLSTMVQDPCTKVMFGRDQDMATMIAANDIWISEKENDEKNDIYSNVMNIEELYKKLREIKFQLWRIDFDSYEGAASNLVQTLEEYGCSVIMLRYMIHNYCIDKEYVASELAGRYLELGMVRWAYYLLVYLDELIPGDESILCSLIDIYMGLGKKDMAKECIKKIKNPGRLLEMMRVKYGL